MPIDNGRGAENKRRIRYEWDLIPVLHTHLLNGHPITCCCGDAVTGKYYRFDAVNRASGVRNVLFAGDGCARGLLRVEPKIDSLPLFNPLQTPDGGGRGDSRRGGGGVSGMAPFNAEMYAVIHLVLMCWGRAPTGDGPLSKILGEIRQAPAEAHPAWTAKSVNTVIGKGSRSLSTMLAALPPQDPPLRHFSFPLLTAALQQAEVAEVWL